MRAMGSMARDLSDAAAGAGVFSSTSGAAAISRSIRSSPSITGCLPNSSGTLHRLPDHLKAAILLSLFRPTGSLFCIIPPRKNRYRQAILFSNWHLTAGVISVLLSKYGALP
jgi:hypothetical protein